VGERDKREGTDAVAEKFASEGEGCQLKQYLDQQRWSEQAGSLLSDSICALTTVNLPGG
jgi:hypothetical protein